jgi:hypothetical protein
MGWTRRKLPQGNCHRDTHWIVAWDGIYVGSVYFGHHLPHHLTERWEWAAQTRPGGHGRVATLELGLEAVRATCLRDGKASLPPPPPKWRPETAW